MKLSFFICIFRSYRNFNGHVGNFIWKTYYIALRLCNKIVYASSRNMYARSLKIRKINYFLTWISYIFDGLKFDLGVNNFRCNLNKLLSIASLWTHCWKDTILTSSSDIYCNFYRLCPWLLNKIENPCFHEFKKLLIKSCMLPASTTTSLWISSDHVTRTRTLWGPIRVFMGMKLLLLPFLPYFCK